MLNVLATAQTVAEATVTETIEMDPISLILNASGPVFVVVWMLIVAAVLVWFIAVLKLLQLQRWRAAEERFETDAMNAEDADALFDIARHHEDAPGARIVFELQKRRDNPKVIESAAKRAVLREQHKVSSMMPSLASIGSASPFIGLFGTVYGIMDAFLRIGRVKTASLPVVAPAIGEALIATAIGLFAAIPAVIAYNAISKRLDDLMDGLDAASIGWVALVGSKPNAHHEPVSNTPSSTALPLAQHYPQRG